MGAQFALTEAVLVLAMLLQRFEFALADARPVLPVGIVTTQPDHRALFRLIGRGKQGTGLRSWTRQGALHPQDPLEPRRSLSNPFVGEVDRSGWLGPGPGWLRLD